MFHEHVSYPFVFTIAVSRRSRPRFLPSRKRPLLARFYSYRVISRSCLYLSGAQEVEGRATNSLSGGMNFGSASAEWFPGLDTVNKTSLSSRIAGLQTFGTEEGKQMVVSVTLSDGNNAKYLIKLPQADQLETAAKERVAREKISSWELEKLGTALSIGDNPLPFGVALKISN